MLKLILKQLKNIFNTFQLRTIYIWPGIWWHRIFLSSRSIFFSDITNIFSLSYSDISNINCTSLFCIWDYCTVQDTLKNFLFLNTQWVFPKDFIQAENRLMLKCLLWCNLKNKHFCLVTSTPFFKKQWHAL